MDHKRETERLTLWLKAVREKSWSAVEAFPADQWRQAPRPGSWSAAQVVVHLCQAETAIQKGMDRLFAADPPHVPLWKRIHIPPVVSQWRWKKTDTPIGMDSSLVDEKEPMLVTYTALRRDTLEILRTGHERDLSRWWFRHPMFGYLHGFEWFRSIGYHELRHTHQLRQIREQLP